MNSTPSTGFKSKPGKSHLSMAAYLAMLSRVRRKSGTIEEVCDAVKRKPTSWMKRLVYWMIRMGLVHVTSWIRQSPKGKLVPRLKFGHSDSAPYPGRTGFEAGQRLTTKPPVALICLQHLVDELMVGATTHRLVEATGVSRAVVLRTLRAGRKLGIVYISAWARRPGVGGDPAPVYQIRLESEVDAVRPRRMTNTEANRGYRIRRKIREAMASNDERAAEAA